MMTETQRRRLTPKQRQRLSELERVRGLARLDSSQLIEEPFPLAGLEVKLRKIVTAEVVTQYALFDELLGSIVARYLFGGRRSFPQLWRTKKFQRFNYYMLEKLSTRDKLEFVRQIRRVPKPVVRTLHALIDLRNALSHTLFPENLRGERTLYKKRDIFLPNTFGLLLADCSDVFEFLVLGSYDYRPAEVEVS